MLLLGILEKGCFASNPLKLVASQIRELMEIIEQQKEEIETEKYKREQVQSSLHVGASTAANVSAAVAQIWTQ